MAQTQKPTQKLYIAAAAAISGAVHDAATHIALDSGAISGGSETTNAPITEVTATGLTRAAATVTVTTGTAPNNGINNVTQATHEFTMGDAGPLAVTGFEVMNAASTGNCLMWCAFAASQSMESGDKLTPTGKMEFQKESTS